MTTTNKTYRFRVIVEAWDAELQESFTVFSRIYTTQRGADKVASRWQKHDGYRYDALDIRIVPLLTMPVEVN